MLTENQVKLRDEAIEKAFQRVINLMDAEVTELTYTTPLAETIKVLQTLTTI